jgi:putative transferase (TIGR04331 family)
LFSGLPAAAFDSRRLGLANLPTEGEFESVLVKSLPHNLPVLLLEGLEPARATVLPNVRFFPSVIVSANAWQDNEVFKVYAAEAADAGSRFVGIQHGGGYGIHRTAAMEAVERSIVDRYLVWGWADDDPMQCRDAPSLQIQQRLDALQASPGRDRRTVLFLSTDDPWFKPVFSNIPIGEQFEEYFGWQFRFFEALSDEFHPRVLFRRYVHDYGRGIPEKLKARFPALQFDDMREWWRTLDERLNGARIVVADNNHTTWLFALAADIPTVVFWNPKHWELRPRAEPYFQDLRRVGILWDRPEAAAVHVQRVYGRVQDWWNSPEVQQVRKRFVQRYASSSENWVQEWRELLFNELRLSEESLPPNVARGRYPPPLRTPAPDAKNGEARNPTGNGLLIKNALSRLNSRLQRQAAATSKGSF